MFTVTLEENRVTECQPCRVRPVKSYLRSGALQLKIVGPGHLVDDNPADLLEILNANSMDRGDTDGVDRRSGR